MCILLLLNIDKFIWYIILLALKIDKVKAVSNFPLSYWGHTLINILYSEQKH